MRRHLYATLISLSTMLAPGWAAAQSPCPSNPSSQEIPYVVGLNSRLFFSSQTEVDTPLANPQVLTGLLRPTAEDPDKLVFGITVFDYSNPPSPARNADTVAGTFEIQIVSLNAAAGLSTSNPAVGVSFGAFVSDYVIHKSNLGGSSVKLARVEIPTSDVFAKLPMVAGDPQFALGTVVGIHRDGGGNVVSCGYMNPISRYAGFSQQSEQALTSLPMPFMVARKAPGTTPAPAEIIEVEPLNVTSRNGSSNWETGVVANPPAINGVATSPTNSTSTYDFAVTYVTYAGDGSANVFSDGVCAAPYNPNKLPKPKSVKNPYPPGTRLEVQLQPLRPQLSAFAPTVRGSWTNGDATAMLPLIPTLNIGQVGYFCTAMVRLPVCAVQNFLGPLPGLDRRIRVGVVEGRHVTSSGGVDVSQTGFYNRANRLLVGSRDLSQISTATAQPVIFLVDQEPVCP